MNIFFAIFLDFTPVIADTVLSKFDYSDKRKLYIVSKNLFHFSKEREFRIIDKYSTRIFSNRKESSEDLTNFSNQEINYLFKYEKFKAKINSADISDRAIVDVNSIICNAIIKVGCQSLLSHLVTVDSAQKIFIQSVQEFLFLRGIRKIILKYLMI